MNLKFLFSFYFSVILLTAGYADSFEVTDEQTTKGQILKNQGETGYVNAGGVISTYMASGISMGADNQIVINKGLITNIGPAARSIFNQGNQALIMNKGVISSSGEGAHCIYSHNAKQVQVINHGLIYGAGKDNNAIYMKDCSDLILINAGTLFAPSGHAINLIGSVNPSLSFLRGSSIQGQVHSDHPLNVTVEKGINLVLTLDQGSGGLIAQQIDNPFIVTADTLVVIDPIGFDMQADQVADLSDVILNDIYPYRTAFPYAPRPKLCNVWVGKLSMGNKRCQTFTPTPCEDLPCGLWIQGLGSYRARHTDELIGYRNRQGGFLVGYDHSLWNGEGGIFGGAVFGKTVASEADQKGDSQSYVGGVFYERLFCETFLGGAFVAGNLALNCSRSIANNLVPGGIENATIDSSGPFITSELTLAQQLPCLWGKPIISSTLRYAGLFLGNYTEEDTLAPFAVKERNIQLLNLRGEISLPFGLKEGTWRWEPYLGFFWRCQFAGNEIQGELLGVPLNFESRTPCNLAAFLFGLRNDYHLGRCDLFFNVEASFDSDDAFRILGEAGVGFYF